jgi:hypothetical protein
MRIVGAADIWRETITAIVAGARDTDPVRATRSLRRILPRLPQGAIVANKLSLINDGLRAPGLGNWQLAGYRLEALLQCG